MNSEAKIPRRFNHLVWIGVALSLFGLISYFTIFVRFPALRDVPWVNIPLVIIGAAVSIWAVVRKRSLFSVAGIMLSVASAVLLVWYVFVYSSALPDAHNALAPGTVAPAVELADQHGSLVRLGDFDDRDVLVVFYRGFW